MTIAEHTSTPAVVQTAGAFTGTTITTASFTPPANSLLVAFVAIGRNGGFTSTPTVTLSGGSLSWTQLTFQNDTVNKFNSAGFFYASVGASPSAMTITATRSDATTAGCLLAVRVLTGAATPPIQLAASVTTGSTTTGSAAVTPNAVGSQIYCGTVWGNTETLTANGNTTTVTDFDDSTDGEHLSFGKGSSLTTSTSSITYGWTGSSSTDNIVQIYEVEASSGTTFTASPANTERLTDSATFVRSVVQTPADPERLSAAVTFVQTLVRAPVDPERLTDLVNAGYLRVGSGADPERLTDSATAVRATVPSVADPERLTDSATFVRSVVQMPAGPERLTDATTFVRSVVRTPADPERLTDLVSAGYLRTPTNSPVPNPMRLTDSASGIKGTDIHTATVAVLDSNGVSTAVLNSNGLSTATIWTT